jgi:hypothetical protein
MKPDAKRGPERRRTTIADPAGTAPSRGRPIPFPERATAVRVLGQKT